MYQLDGKGNIYDAESGRALFTGNPETVLTLLETVDALQSANQLLTTVNQELTQTIVQLANENHELRNQAQLGIFYSLRGQNGEGK